ncbi:DUF1697 domain-containing protein [Paraglaciecola aquimarina]|uniref:DUF1697 domain-containing protein n=1 Tax=Paraglaciecola algarum TaxID=3050085 RepID=A0ABS9D6S1_9ALTE|nr:DUF1697 domain-containing protein [Paraglaciecola sp. G1-23]MCF2948672.1 DUF1697 domain-containing protein [Paraglaciecola sp. G1-23]
MFKWCVLLRGINVGGNNIIPMKALVSMFEAMGCEQVKTYIQSGNVVLHHIQNDAAELTRLIQQKIAESFHCSPQILLLSVEQFSQALDNNPFVDAELKTVHWFFLAQQPTQVDFGTLENIKKPSESFQLLDSVFYLHAPEGIGRSKLVTKVEKCLAVPTTARNGNTVTKLMAMLE